MATPGAGPGPGPPPGLEAALQKLVLRRKKVLSAEEMELYELAQAAGGAMDPDVFKILVDLLKLNVAPLAVFQMLKSMCAGQRLASEPQDPPAVSLPTSSVPETREASFLFAKNCSPPARASFSSAPRPAASPVLHHSPAATHSPLSPGPPGSLREKQKQHCSWWRPHPGRTKLPGRIQPEDAQTAQCYQAAQGGGAWEEPHSEQYLSHANHMLWAPPAS